MEAKVERSKDRAERHREYADNAAKKAEGCMNSAHQILDIIPPGQPILVGHHSEGRHRRDLARVDRYFEKAREEDKAAAYHKQRAGASASFERRSFNMATTLRRIQRLEADFRRFHRELDQQELRRNTTAALGSPERAWNIARNKWIGSGAVGLLEESRGGT
jgi:hypothetical protein